MNLLVSGLIGYALKEVVVPLVSDHFDDKKGHILLKNQPIAICDKTAGALADLGRDDIYISESTWHYDGGGCC